MFVGGRGGGWGTRLERSRAGPLSVDGSLLVFVLSSAPLSSADKELAAAF